MSLSPFCRLCALVLGALFAAALSAPELHADDVQLCMRVKGGGVVSRCGWSPGNGVEGCSGFGAAADAAAITRIDDTYGGTSCALGWRIKSTNPARANLRVCAETTSTRRGACKEEGVRCSGFSDTNNDLYSPDITDQTGRRGGECKIRFKLESKEQPTATNRYVWRLCWESSRTGSDACNGATSGATTKSCSGWTNNPAWSDFLVDGSSATPGGCRQRFWVERLATGTAQAVQCSDLRDNDGDGATDYPNDAACSGPPDDDEGDIKTECQDLLDNDGDTLIDLKDPGCTDAQDTSESSATAQCRDGIDNDNDGAIDFPNDFSCQSALDSDESLPKAECQDGIDNDSDVLIDLLDMGCRSLQDSSESDKQSECQDARDNDGDGLVDGSDPGCWADRQRASSYQSGRDNESLATSQCQDGVDNDGDGVSDLMDPGCTNPIVNDESLGMTECQDGLDNDGDGLSDAKDPGCWSDRENSLTYVRTSRNEGRATSECQDGVDNDGDLVVDALDPGCWTTVTNPATYLRTRLDEGAGTTQCQDSKDNDGDGVLDDQDPGCWRDPYDAATYDATLPDESPGTPACQDRVDNDGDGALDLKDPGCASALDIDERDGRPECSDGVDNDGDGLVDKRDPGCWRDPTMAATYDSALDAERAATTQCQDRVDNDGDTLVDFVDPGCWRISNAPGSYVRVLNDESRAITRCQDGLDNDADGLTDLLDPGCLSKQDNNEADGTTKCQDRVDNDADLLIDAADPGCWRDVRDPRSYVPLDNDESDGTSQCQNFRDDDGDSLIDLADPGCARRQDDFEGDGTSLCQDRLDNDSDGLIDGTDPGCWRDKQSNTTYDKSLNSEGSRNLACQDSRDNDGDGLIDLADGGCSSILDDNEGDDPVKVQVSTECVQDNGDGTYTAYFSYDNQSGGDLTIPIGMSGKTTNAFTPGAASRGQPTLLKVGKNKGAFTVSFSGGSLTWALRAEKGAVSQTSASIQSAPCKPLVPQVECIDGGSDGFFATLGYENPNDFTMWIPVGRRNSLEPPVTLKLQPVRFLAGRNRGVFSVPFTSTLSWLLTGNTATVTAGTPVCPGGCVETPVTATRSALEARIADIALLTNQAADTLLASAKRKLRGAQLRAVQRVVASAKRGATRFAADALVITGEFPSSVKSCPYVQPACTTTDRASRIQTLQSVVAKQVLDLQRLGADRYSKKVAPSGELRRLRAKAVSSEGAIGDLVGYLPRLGVSCPR